MYQIIYQKNYIGGQTSEINLNGKVIGILGKIHPIITKEDVFVFEINLDMLKEFKTGKMKYKEISKFPPVKKDISMVVENKITNDDIQKTIKKYAGSLLTNIELFDIYTGENIGENKKSMAYSLTFGAKDKTLTDEETNALLEKIIADLEKKLGAELRK